MHGEAIHKLRAIFRSKYESIPASGTNKRKEWEPWLEGLGAQTVNKLTLFSMIFEDSLGDLVAVDDPSFMLDSYILIPRDVAWKILVLNHVPESMKDFPGS